MRSRRRFEKFGTADLKNISLPMDLFRIVLPWETGAKVESGDANFKEIASPGSGRRSRDTRAACGVVVDAALE